MGILALSAALLLPALPAGARDGSVTLAAVGDVRLDGPVGNIIRTKGPDAPTAGVREALAADLVLANLETPITTRGKKLPKKWNFRAPARRLRALRRAGIGLLNLANNHVMDYGTQGLLDTLAALDLAGLIHVGAGRDKDSAFEPVIAGVNGVRVGVLGATSTFPEEAWAGKRRPGVAFADPDDLARAVRKAKGRCDVLVVSFHGGTELAEEPNETQREASRAAIDAGADLVLGHHPHVVQPVEVYKGRFIAHSLGNFLFVSPAPATRWGVIARAVLSKNGVVELEFVPIDTWHGEVRPAPPEGAEAARRALDRYGAFAASPRLKFKAP